MSRSRILTGLVACVLLSWTGIARADAVTVWNAIAIQTIVTGVPVHPGATAVLDSAMVQAAVVRRPGPSLLILDLAVLRAVEATSRARCAGRAADRHG